MDIKTSCHLYTRSTIAHFLNPMLLLANFVNTKWCRKPEKLLKPWKMGTHLRVLLDKSFPMNTNMTGQGLNGFQETLDESSHNIGRVNPLMLRGSSSKCCLVLLIITVEIRMIFQIIWRGVVCYVLNNISPSNFFLTLLLPARFHQNCPLLLAAMSINGLTNPRQCHCCITAWN